MDPWKEYAAREECRNALRGWADLEGKSAAMSDDLSRELAPWRRSRIDRFKLLGFVAHIAAAASEALRMFRSG